MRIRSVCGCGLENYTRDDWIAHYKYGNKHSRWARFWRATWLLLTTKFEIVRLS